MTLLLQLECDPNGFFHFEECVVLAVCVFVTRVRFVNMMMMDLQAIFILSTAKREEDPLIPPMVAAWPIAECA